VADYILCRFDQLVEGRGRPARAGDRYLAVFLVEGRVHVLDNQCLHVQSPIDGGPVIDNTVRCPWHGWAYDLETGAHLTSFGERPGLRSYAARVDAGQVVVSVDDREDAQDPVTSGSGATGEQPGPVGD
jgi:nitrite reductase/ring-hydroxylating ferredoxin subunit